MSDTESRFIRQLKITLIAILTPFVVTGIVNAIFDHVKIKNNQEAIMAIRGNYVSNDLLLLYVNTFREANQAALSWQASHDQKDLIRFNDLESRMDEMMREIYRIKTRGLDDIADTSKIN